MIKITRLNGKEFRLNAEFIVSVESVPDTLITLRNGKTLMVKESTELVVKRFIHYKRKILSSPWTRQKSPEADSPVKSD